MNRPSTLTALLLEAGGLLLFWGLGTLGLDRIAPIAVVAFVLADGLRRSVRRLGFPRVWRLFNGLALALAALDIAARGQPWAGSASIVGNLLIAGLFAIGALGPRPLVQEIAEQRQGAPFPPDRRDLLAFFRAYSWVWAGYFAARAALWLVLQHSLPAEPAHADEAWIGPLSLFAMILVSFRGRALFDGLRRLGLFRT